jgi:dephospho-CoA kinase
LKKTVKIGLTGALGSGKSSVAFFLRDRLAAEYIDADLICRHLLMPNEKGWHALRQALGPEFFSPDKTVDRTRVRQVIFSDGAVRSRINRLLHPLAREEVVARINKIERRGGGPIVVEVPLLFEAAWEDIFDRIVVVYVDCNTCLQRIMRRDAVTLAEAESGLAAQSSLLDKVVQADHVIDNSGHWTDTCLQLLHLSKRLQESMN